MLYFLLHTMHILFFRKDVLALTIFYRKMLCGVEFDGAKIDILFILTNVDQFFFNFVPIFYT